MGSFFNVCIHRIPKGESIVSPPSRCPNCGRKLSFWDLIPVFSFIFLKGRCRYCNEKINLRYPIVEILSTALFVGFYFKFHFTYFYFKYVLLFSALLIIFFIDLAEKIIPDIITLPCTALGILSAAYESFTLKNYVIIVDSISGVVLGYAVLIIIAFLGKLIFKKEAMGGGDIKLSGMLGSFLGWKLNAITLYLSFIIGGVIAILLLIFQRKKLKDQIAFGPSIIIGALLALFLRGETLKILNLYF